MMKGGGLMKGTLLAETAKVRGMYIDAIKDAVSGAGNTVICADTPFYDGESCGIHRYRSLRKERDDVFVLYDVVYNSGDTDMDGPYEDELECLSFDELYEIANELKVLH
ncbi:MAG: hypothetical protein IAC29_00190 [Bacteroidetes bacterium]|uniref:Uncharacterized protein n=1 Tax=Candidatus Cryptobacteroides merdigallinarum TaxID=2840770 RepID=A0A9D9HEB9_9BACT|nr:hypothetical protein [Candidatus Cryptobacteroides merdigallinarum]